MMAYYSIMGLPFDYQKELIKKITEVTPEQIQQCANKYFTEDFVLAVLKPEI